MEQKFFKVIQILQMQQGTTERGDWRSQDIIVESTENVQYPDRYMLHFSGAGVDKLADIKVGMQVTAQWSANVRKFKTKNGSDGYMQELRCWKIEVVNDDVKPF